MLHIYYEYKVFAVTLSYLVCSVGHGNSFSAQIFAILLVLKRKLQDSKVNVLKESKGHINTRKIFDLKVSKIYYKSVKFIQVSGGPLK